MSDLIETRVLFFLKEIIRCIKEPTVVSHLVADGVISSDESCKLKQLYDAGNSFKANEEMIDCLLKSRAVGRWRSFLEALERSDYHHLKSLLESKVNSDVGDERARNIIRVFTPYLERTISALDIVTELYSKNVINDVDKQEILAKYQNKGDTYATIFLLERMQCRLAPDEWYYIFLCTLRDKDLGNVVQEIEPDFLDCPYQFRPPASKTTAIETTGSTGLFATKRKTTFTEIRELNEENNEAGYSASDTEAEDVLTDYFSAEEDMGDQGVPGPVDNENCSPEVQTLVEDFIQQVKVNANTSNNKLITEEPFKNTPSQSCCEKNDERKPPEGQEFNVSSSSDRVDDPPDCDQEETTTKAEVNTTSSICNDTPAENSESFDSEAESDLDEQNYRSDDSQQPLIDKLYPFQLELAEKALAGENTIICAPTGSGKTWVAMYIIDEHFKSQGNGNKKVAFMARNGVLVGQQADRLTEQLPYARVKHLVGDTEEAQMMQAFIDDYDVFFFTPQILVNNLSKDIKSLSKFSLLVFDECHHTKGETPYNLLMKQYHLEKSEGTERLPQIVGLTASIGTGRAKSEKDALDHIFGVCANLDVRCLSLVKENIEDLAKHVSLPTEEIVSMKRRETDPCRGILLQAIRETGHLLSEQALLKPKLIPLMHKCPNEVESKQYGIWTSEVVRMAESLPSGQGRDVASCAKYLQIYYNALEVNRLLRTQDVATYIAEQHAQEAEHQDRLTQNEKHLLIKLTDVQRDLLSVKTENPNIQIMSKLLMNLFAEDDNNSRAMIFVHARSTSRALAEYINEALEGIFVKASPLLGKERRGTDEGMTEEEQVSVINNFREGNFKVIVATSVGMEGLDVPDCNMILNYNFSGDEITKIQMSGRSRKEGGKAYIIGSDTQFQKDNIALYRVELMKAAIEKFTQLDKNSINRQILALQKKELESYKWLLKTRELKRSRQSDEIDYEIHCKTCGINICNASNLRKYETSHLVALKDFDKKIRREEHRKRASMGALQKRYKMFCKMCPNDWGVIAVKGGLEYFILKLESLKFVSSVDPNDVNFYKKWPDIPYKVSDISLQDLSYLYAKVD